MFYINMLKSKTLQPRRSRRTPFQAQPSSALLEKPSPPKAPRPDNLGFLPPTQADLSPVSPRRSDVQTHPRHSQTESERERGGESRIDHRHIHAQVYAQICRV